MPHPFFEFGRYPWEIEEARALHKALYQKITSANEIDLIYRECGGELDPLEKQAPKAMWTAALDGLATAQLLRVLGERLEARRATYAAAYKAFQVAASIPDPVRAPETRARRIFVNREALRGKIDQMGGNQSALTVLLVRGPKGSGKTWTKYLLEDLAETAGDESVYLASGLVATAEDALDKIFAVLRGKVPPRRSTEDAWFRTACNEMVRLAGKRGRGRYWVIADDLSELDPLIVRFFDQAALEMQNRAFSKWFRLALIDYPQAESPDANAPSKWKGFWSEDRCTEGDVTEAVLAKFLLLWAQHKQKTLTESGAAKLAGEVVANTQVAVQGDNRPLLERIHDELATRVLPSL